LGICSPSRAFQACAFQTPAYNIPPDLRQAQ
jgi:hypothetical protein